MKWVAFLRAINTGGRRVTGDRLAAIFETLGHESVSSFQASGNVLFSADHPVRSTIESALEAELGYPVPLALRDRDDIHRIVADMPFSESELARTEGRVQVMFLLEPHDDARLGPDDVPPDDLLVPRESEIYWLPQKGISGSKLSPSRLETALGPITIRTLGTIQRIEARM